LKEKQAELDRSDVAIIRLESLCPFPVLELQKIVTKYSGATGTLKELVSVEL
jgi:2-oxoglutarate dehydrogenase complex dehydrogenase (E1) component-like enzyme